MRISSKDIYYVSIQLVLFLLFFFNLEVLSIRFPLFINNIGGVITVLGIATLILGIIQLSHNLSPFPTPKKEGSLIESGIYHFIRHPIYSGILMGAFGFSLYTNSGMRGIVTLLLFILFYFKSIYEEKKLIETYSNYIHYRQRTGRFFPKLTK